MTDFARYANENIKSAHTQLQSMKQYVEERNINPVLDNIVIIGVLVDDFQQFTKIELENTKSEHASDFVLFLRNGGIEGERGVPVQQNGSREQDREE